MDAVTVICVMIVAGRIWANCCKCLHGSHSFSMFDNLLYGTLVILPNWWTWTSISIRNAEAHSDSENNCDDDEYCFESFVHHVMWNSCLGLCFFVCILCMFSLYAFSVWRGCPGAYDDSQWFQCIILLTCVWNMQNRISFPASVPWCGSTKGTKGARAKSDLVQTDWYTWYDDTGIRDSPVHMFNSCSRTKELMRLVGKRYNGYPNPLLRSTWLSLEELSDLHSKIGASICLDPKSIPPVLQHHVEWRCCLKLIKSLSHPCLAHMLAHISEQNSELRAFLMNFVSLLRGRSGVRRVHFVSYHHFNSVLLSATDITFHLSTGPAGPVCVWSTHRGSYSLFPDKISWKEKGVDINVTVQNRRWRRKRSISSPQNLTFVWKPSDGMTAWLH